MALQIDSDWLLDWLVSFESCNATLDFDSNLGSLMWTEIRPLGVHRLQVEEEYSLMWTQCGYTLIYIYIHFSHTQTHTCTHTCAHLKLIWNTLSLQNYLPSSNPAERRVESKPMPFTNQTTSGWNEQRTLTSTRELQSLQPCMDLSEVSSCTKGG